MIGIVLVAAVPTAIIGIGRLHDRGKSGLWSMVFYALPAALTVASAFHPVTGDVVLFPVAINIANWVLTLWAIVELGFLRGDGDANRFGPAPA